MTMRLSPRAFCHLISAWLYFRTVCAVCPLVITSMWFLEHSFISYKEGNACGWRKSEKLLLVIEPMNPYLTARKTLNSTKFSWVTSILDTNTLWHESVPDAFAWGQYQWMGRSRGIHCMYGCRYITERATIVEALPAAQTFTDMEKFCFWHLLFVTNICLPIETVTQCLLSLLKNMWIKWQYYNIRGIIISQTWWYSREQNVLRLNSHLFSVVPHKITHLRHLLLFRYVIHVFASIKCLKQNTSWSFSNVARMGR